jgi:uncharacterized membrane protein
MARKPVSYVLIAAAAGELIADKLPLMPDRRMRGSVIGRAIAGAICGAVLITSEHSSPVLGAAIGAAAATAGTYTLFTVRRELTSHGLPDPLVALCEDAFVIGLSLSALRGPALRTD